MKKCEKSLEFHVKYRRPRYVLEWLPLLLSSGCQFYQYKNIKSLHGKYLCKFDNDQLKRMQKDSKEDVIRAVQAVSEVKADPISLYPSLAIAP